MSAMRKRKREEWELAETGSKPSDADVLAHVQAAIAQVDAKIAAAREEHPDIAIQIYGTSTGSGPYGTATGHNKATRSRERANVHEGEMQFVSRGGKSSIQWLERPGGRSHNNLRLGDLRGHGHGGEAVCDCCNSRCLSKEVETALHVHYRKRSRQVGIKILYTRDGAGAPQGIGPYDVCLRIVPLPLPEGMHITVEQEGAAAV